MTKKRKSENDEPVDTDHPPLVRTVVICGITVEIRTKTPGLLYERAKRLMQSWPKTKRS